MASTHTALDLHIIFSTKTRLPLIHRDWRDDLHAYLGACVRQTGGHATKVGGTADHVHLAAGLRPAHAVAEVLRDIKTASSKWVHEQIGQAKFAWQEGYGAFAIERRHLPALVRYIEAQEEHHRRRTFQEEYRSLLDRLGVEYDERYLW